MTNEKGAGGVSNTTGASPCGTASTKKDAQNDRADDTAPNGGIAHRDVVAHAFPPAGRRRLLLVLVATCPYCAGAHAHRVPAGLAGELRRAGCARGRYRLDTTPAAAA